VAVYDLWYRKVEGRRDKTALYGSGKRWQARWRDAHDVQRKRNFVNRDEAERFLADLRITPEVRQSRLTVGQQYEVWIRTKRGLSAGHVANIESKWRNHVAPVWAHRRLTDVTHSDVAGWAAELSAATSESIARQALLVLSGIFRLAVRSGLAADPTAGVMVQTPIRRVGRFLTAAQVQTLAEACGRDAVVIRVLAFTGIRWGEMAGLRVRDLDVERGRLTVARSVSELGGVLTVSPKPKNRRSREVGVPPLLLAELAALAEGRPGDDPLLPARRGGIRRYSRFYNRWRQVVDRLGWGDLRPHDLRHTAASLAIASGADVKAVQEMLGHSSGALTLDLYTHRWDAGLDEVARRMGDYEGGGGA
jgi:integrase